MKRSRRFEIILAQCLMVLASLLIVTLKAPQVGPMLVVPLGSTSQAALADISLREKARLLGGGPLPGSLIIYGERSTLEPAFWDAHAVLLAAPAILCGNAPALRDGATA